ncbi:MAG: hypothetical protein ABJF86_09715 [Tateyamaria sp.]|uniref:hypothetical protein n=1 Tax=Tateyamaria sp. TaxID=1929288 RepID=UPI003270A42E
MELEIGMELSIDGSCLDFEPPALGGSDWCAGLINNNLFTWIVVYTEPNKDSEVWAFDEAIFKDNELSLGVDGDFFQMTLGEATLRVENKDWCVGRADQF